MESFGVVVVPVPVLFFFFPPISSAAQPFSRVRCTLTGTSTAKNDATGQKGSQTQNWRTVKHHSALTYSKLPSDTRKGARHFIIYLWLLKSHRFSIGQLLKDFYWERHNYFLLANRITVSVMLFFFFFFLSCPDKYFEYTHCSCIQCEWPSW